MMSSIGSAISSLLLTSKSWLTPYAPFVNGETTIAGRVAANRRKHVETESGAGVVVGAFADDRLVGIGIVLPHLPPQIAQLAFLHVSAPFRKTGIGTLGELHQAFEASRPSVVRPPFGHVATSDCAVLDMQCCARVRRLTP